MGQRFYNRSPVLGKRRESNSSLIGAKDAQTARMASGRKEKLVQSSKKNEGSRSFVAYSTRDVSKNAKLREDKLRTPEPLCREEVQRFIPIKYNNGIDMENYANGATRNSANIEKIVNSLNRFKLYPNNSSNKERVSGSLMNSVNAESKDKEQSQLDYFREQAQRLQAENAELRRTVRSAQDQLNAESSKLFLAMERIANMETDLAMLRKERDRLKAVNEKNSTTLNNSLQVLKYFSVNG